MTDDIARIAAGLTKAQREAYLRHTANPRWEPPMWIRAYDHRLVESVPSVMGFGFRLRWLPLGLAVRAHLENQAHD